jgi:hypothetical protein
MKRLLFVVLATLAAQAQLNRGSLTGTLTDPTGGVIPEARVTIRNSNTGATYETRTNAAGQYNMPNLPPGAYELTFEAPSFKKLVRSGIELGVTDVVRVDATLEVGSVAESVQISAEAPRLQSDTPEVGTSLTNKELVDLPISWSGEGRVPENFAFKVSPGVSGDVWTSHINGSASFSKESLLDGATVTTYLSGHFEEGSVSTEALQEFKIQTSGMAAEFGRSQGGIFNYVMKSGANQIHGSLYGSLRNEALNANTFVNKARGASRTPDRKQNYAASFGAPVYIPKLYNGRNRTFFYTAYERYKERTLGLGAPTLTNPVAEFYQGDFSRLLGAATGQTDAMGRPVYRGAIYDPLTFSQLPGGRWIGQPFEGNRIPVARFSQVSQRLNSILQKSYLPTERDASGLAPLVNNASAPVSQQPQFDYYMFSAKGDQIISSRQKLSGSYSYGARPRLLIDRGAMWAPNDPVGGPLAKSRYQRVKTDLARLAYDFTISPRLLNFFTVYYNRQGNPSIGTQANVDGAKELGIRGLSTFGYPNIEWNTGPFVTLSNTGYTSKGNIENVGSGFLDTVSFSRGRHFMKTGFDFRRNQLNTQPTQGGTLRFNPRATAIPNETFSGNLTGFAFASYLLGIVDNGALSDPIGLGARRHYYALFFQDDFKVSSRLTLNLGVRWEYQPPGFEVADRLSSWNPNKIDPASGLPGAYDFAGNCSVCTGSRTFGRRSLRDWGPRVGFAWQPLQKWTIRGAYGIFYEADLFDNFDGTPLGKRSNVAWGGTWNLDADPVQPWAGIFNWDNGFPVSRFQPAGFDVSWGNRNRPGMIDPNYGRSGYIQMWNVNAQYEIVRNLVIDIGYVANKSTGLHAGELQRINQLPPSVLSQFGSRLNNAVRSAADAAANGVRYPFPGFSGTVGSALRPFPQVQGTQTVEVYGAPLGFSTYNSLQVVVNRQFSRGLSVYGNYVWSKYMANLQSSLVSDNVSGSNRPLDYYNLKLEKAVSQHDIPHMFKAFADYELPIGRGKALASNSGRVANALAGGWSISAILNYFSGLPLGFTGSAPLSAQGWNGVTNRANIAPGNLRADFNKSAFELSNLRSPNNTYLNKSLFSDPPPLTLGTSAYRYTQARDFGTISEDFGLQKNNRIGEKFRFQLRAEFLNLFNRHRFGGITTSVTNQNFGQVTSVSGNRQIQLGARLDF